MQASSDQIMEISQAEASVEPVAEEAPEAPQETVETSSEAAPEVAQNPDQEAANESQEAVEEAAPEKEASTPTPQEDPVEILDLGNGLKLPSNTPIPVKVDGKIVNVPLSELRTNGSAKIAVQERFAEANKVKQKAEHQARQYSQKEYGLKRISNRFIEAMQQGNTRDAVDILCQFTGQDPEPVWQEVSRAQKEAITKLANMTAEQWREHEARQDAEYFRRKLDVTEATRVEEDLMAKKLEYQEKHGLEDEEIKQATQIMLDWQKQGVYNKPLTLEDVVSTALDYRIYKSIDETIREILPEKAGDTRLYNEILADTKQHNLTKEDWLSIFGKIKEDREKAKASSKLGAKVAANVSPKAPKKSTKPPVSVGEDDLLDFGVDLDRI